MSLLTEGLHSATDVAAAFLALLSVRTAGIPPDESHPYGHERVETVSSLFEAGLLAAFSVILLYRSVSRLFNPTEVHQLTLGILALFVCSLISFSIGIVVYRTGRRTGSRALETNGYHLFSDACVSFGVMVALVVIQFSGLHWIDASVGSLLSLILLVGSIRLGSRSFQELIDRRLPDEDLELIKQIISESPGLISFHRLRTRFAGRSRWIDVHLVVPREWSVVEAHAIADGVEKRLHEKLSPVFVVTHVDPYDISKVVGGGNPKP